jgi:hypothetical protein
MPKMPDKSELEKERKELAEERRKREEEKNKNRFPYKRKRQGFSKGTPKPNKKGGIATRCGKVMSNKRKVTKVF